MSWSAASRGDHGTFRMCRHLDSASSRMCAIVRSIWLTCCCCAVVNGVCADCSASFSRSFSAVDLSSAFVSSSWYLATALGLSLVMPLFDRDVESVGIPCR